MPCRVASSPWDPSHNQIAPAPCPTWAVVYPEDLSMDDELRICLRELLQAIREIPVTERPMVLLTVEELKSELERLGMASDE